MEETIEAAGMVLMSRTRPAQILLLRHADRWDLPKGHLEPGEQLTAAALRETEEETGIAASAIEVDPEFRFIIEYSVKTSKRGSYHKRVTYFLGYLDQLPPIRLTEHIGHRWQTWPVRQSIQEQTIDPLLRSLSQHLGEQADE